MARVILGLGSNRERRKHINAGLLALHAEYASETHPIRCSRVFESAAIGFAGHDFYNCVVELYSDQSLAMINQFCKATEIEFGHSSDAAKYSPRTLDIDILLYDDWVCDQPVVLPRAEILTNAFVLWPLAELNPELRHPLVARSYAELWQNYTGQQRIAAIEFEFVSLPHLRIVSP